MSGFQAGLAKNWKVRLAALKNRRKKRALQWAEISPPPNIHNYVSRNGGIPDLIRYPLRIKDASKWRQMLKASEKSGLGVMFTYPGTVNEIDELMNTFKGESYPAAEKLPRQLLTLPVHPYISQKDVNNILKLFAKMPGHG